MTTMIIHRYIPDWIVLVASLSPILVSASPLPLLTPSSALRWNVTPVPLPSIQNENYPVPLNKAPPAELYQEWPETGANFPNPFYDPFSCNRPDNSAKGRNWVCDPDGQLSSDQVSSLSNKIEVMLNNFKCMCKSCSNTHPRGRYSIGVAIASNITGSDREVDRAKMLSYNLRTRNWINMKRCNDMVVIALSTGGRAVYVSPDPLVAVIMDSACVRDILDKTRQYFESGDYRALDETLDYIKNALDGGRCGTKSGLSVGQIVGIVLGVLAAVGFIITIITLCVGFFQDWECVAQTCLGMCIGCILAQIQACINAIIFSVFQSILAECGCEDCCDCEPFDCLPEDSPDAGGGMEY